MDSIGGKYRFWLSRWMVDSVPADIADDLRHAQLDSLIAQVPVLLAVAALNTLIIMAVCAWNGLPIANYGWLGLLVVYTIVRGHFIKRQFAAAVTPQRQRRALQTSTIGAILVLAALGVTAAATYAVGLFNQSLLIPMSLGFGAISIAHCLYRLHRVALAAIVLGIGPSALVLMAVGDFEAKMLGVSMISVGLLMMRFVSAQYHQLIDNLCLHQHIRTMANSDPLTGLANRRAIDECLDRHADNASLAIVLVDLDGFKQVNDSHGHDIGDAVLRIVAERLVTAMSGRGLVGRQGGDEFVIVLTEADDEGDIGAAVTGLLAALCVPMQIGTGQLSLGASVGHALRHGASESLSSLMKRADETLYVAKGLQGRRPASQFGVSAA